MLLILLPRSTPIQILILEAIFRRLNPNHWNLPELQKEYNRRKKGLTGEKNVDYYLGYLPPKQCNIFRGIRLIHDNKPFQIDALLISKKFLLLIEVKNIGGKLHFDEVYKQLIWINDDGEQQVMEDPLEQVKRQSRQLIKWLGKSYYLPIEYLVVIGDSRTYIDPKSGPEYKNHILHAYSLEEKIMGLSKKYQSDILSQDSFRKLSSRLLKGNNPITIDPQRTYRYSPSDIAKGIQCPECKRVGMKRVHQKWMCPYCKAYSRDAHKQAILDYLLLVKPTITNRECREFLGIESRKIVQSLLTSMNLPYKGFNKSRVYYYQNI